MHNKYSSKKRYFHLSKKKKEKKFPKKKINGATVILVGKLFYETLPSTSKMIPSNKILTTQLFNYFLKPYPTFIKNPTIHPIN